MTVPNLKNPATITGKTAVGIATTTLTSVLSNGASSNKVLKINTIRAANVTTTSATVGITLYRGSTHYYLIDDTTVAPTSSVVVIDKNEYLYLEEGDDIYAIANGISNIHLVINYEEIS